MCVCASVVCQTACFLWAASGYFLLLYFIAFACFSRGRGEEAKPKTFASKFSVRNEMLERIAERERERQWVEGRGQLTGGMCQHLFLLSDLGKTFYPDPPPSARRAPAPATHWLCCQPMFRCLAFVPGIMVRQHARHGNWEWEGKREGAHCGVIWNIGNVLQNFRNSYNAAKLADLAEWLPHNRRQVKFIFLTNNMNFKDPVSHFHISPFFQKAPLPLPPAPAQPACNSLAQPISFFALVAVSSDKEIEMLRASVCVCAVYVCGTPYTSLLCVGVAQLINCGYKLIRVPNER